MRKLGTNIESLLRSERGVGIMEALVVTVIVAVSALAFLTLAENQGVFLKKTRQTSARDQLNFFFQGVVRDRGLFLFSASHPKNEKLRACLGDHVAGKKPQCDFGKKNPLWLVDLTDPTYQRVWTAPPDTPVLFDELGQGCDPKIKNNCRFEVSTVFQPMCPGGVETCERPERIIVTFNLKQLYSNDKTISPLSLRPTTLSHPHLLLFNKPPQIVGAPLSVRLTPLESSKSYQLTASNEIKEHGLLWLLCESTDSSVLAQCLSTQDDGKLTVTLRLRTHEFDRNVKIRLQLANEGPTPNASEIVEIAVQVAPFCVTPWGEFMDNGAKITAYENQLVGASENCTPEPITCVDGILQGKGRFQQCKRRQTADCKLPWGETLTHSQSRAVFGLASVPFGTICPQENRVCNDGLLSGSAQHPTCNVQPAARCGLPWGGNIGHAETVNAYSANQVPFGQDCETIKQVRMCNNGTLQNGPNSIQNCTVAPPRDCRAPWGAVVVHNSNVTAFAVPSVPPANSCHVNGVKETRTCNDGTLSGNFAHANCVTL